MSISCQTLYNDIVAQVGAGTGNEKLQNAFIRAVNRSLDNMSIRANLATAHSHISQTNSTISTLDAKYEYVLASGCLYWIIRIGFPPSDPRIATVLYRDTADSWNRSIGEYVADLINVTQSDETEDMAKLGYVTTD